MYISRNPSPYILIVIRYKVLENLLYLSIIIRCKILEILKYADYYALLDSRSSCIHYDILLNSGDPCIPILIPYKILEILIYTLYTLFTF